MQSRKPVANPVVVLREEFDDWAVLFNPDTAAAIGISPVGVEIWKLLDGTRSPEDIAASLQDLFDDVPDTALEDVQIFLEELTERGFVGHEVEAAP